MARHADAVEVVGRFSVSPWVKGSGRGGVWGRGRCQGCGGCGRWARGLGVCKDRKVRLRVATSIHRVMIGERRGMG